MLEKTCLVCEKVFEKPYNESLNNWNNRHRYCSKKCKDNAPISEDTRKKMRERKIGKPTWNKGKKLSEIHKLHLRKEHKKILDTSNYKGRRPWNKIRDGITPLNKRIRQSREIKWWRKSVFERDHYTCVCGQWGRELEAHHLKPFSQYPELRFDVSNGITLCKKCHKKTESYGNKSGRNQFFNSNKIAKNTNAA